MTDRELLEMAAKAAGIECEIEEFSNGRCMGTNEYSEIVFDPLTDDGDALRLAIELRIEVGFSGFCVWAVQPYKNARAEETETMGYSIEEATRRAIVRAAAAIGEQS